MPTPGPKPKSRSPSSNDVSSKPFENGSRRCQNMNCAVFESYRTHRTVWAEIFASGDTHARNRDCSSMGDLHQNPQSKYDTIYLCVHICAVISLTLGSLWSNRRNEFGAPASTRVFDFNRKRKHATASTGFIHKGLITLILLGLVALWAKCLTLVV